MRHWSAVVVTVLLACSTSAWAQNTPTQMVVAGDEPFVVASASDVLLGRGYLGIEMLDLNAELRQFFGASTEAGVLVARVSPGSPADVAGLRVGDVVVAVDSLPAMAAGDLIRAVRPRSSGDRLQLEVVRDRQRVMMTAILSEREREFIMLPTDGLGVDDMNAEGLLALEAALSRAFGAYGDPSMAIELQSSGELDAMARRIRAFEERIAQLEAALRGKARD